MCVLLAFARYTEAAHGARGKTGVPEYSEHWMNLCEAPGDCCGASDEPSTCWTISYRGPHDIVVPIVKEVWAEWA